MTKRKDLALLADRLSEKFEKRMKSFPGSPTHIITELLLEAKAEIGGRGVGGVIDRGLGVDLLYIDRGDAKKATIIYDHFMEKFLVGRHSELIEIYRLIRAQEGVFRGKSRVGGMVGR